MQIGFIGLGKMGSRMATKLSSDGHQVVVWNRSIDALKQFEKTKIKTAESIGSLISQLESPRIVWIMVSHQAVDDVLNELRKYLGKGDIVIDGGNSHYKDTDKRFEEFSAKGIHFLGIGTSGGILAAKNGYPFMVGGSVKGYQKIKPILDSLSQPNGVHAYFGIGGAGHFVKMIHNGIEYGMMQSIGEGFDVLKNSKYDLDLSKVASNWQKGTIVSGFLIDRASDMLSEDKDLSRFKGVVSRSGEGDWTLEAAREEGIPVRIISESVEYRKLSEDSKDIQNSFTARMLNALRKAFGGHETGKIKN